MTFPYKTDALSAIEQQPEKRLFSEDIHEGEGNKRFFIANYEELFDMCYKKKRSFYENFEKGESVKLFLDIDYKPVDHPQERYTFDYLLNETLKLVNDKLKKDYNIKKPKMIVMDATTDQKISMHVTYINVHFDDVYKIGTFMKELKHKLIDQKIIDISIYKQGCFRMLWSSKKGKNNTLKYKCGINYNPENDKQLFYDSLVKTIKQNSSLVNIILPEKPKQQPKSSVLSPVDFTPIQCNEEYEELVYMLDIKKHVQHYSDWFKTASLIKNLGFSFEVFHNISKMATTYTSEQDCLRMFNQIRPHQTNIALLHVLAKKSNPPDTITQSLI